MPPILSHEQCRAMVCMVCMRKHQNLEMKSSTLSLIKKHLLSNYDLDDPQIPSKICLQCKLLLYAADKDEAKLASLPSLFDFSKIFLARQTRSTNPAFDCSCQICVVVRQNPIGKPGRSRSPSPKPGRPPKQSSIDRQPSSGPMTLCKRCYAKFGPGIRHSCNTSTSHIAENILELATPDKAKEQFVSQTLKSKIFTQPSGSGSLQLSTGGKPLQVTMGQPSASASNQISLNEMLAIRTKNNLSGKATAGIA